MAEDQRRNSEPKEAEGGAAKPHEGRESTMDLLLDELEDESAAEERHAELEPNAERASGARRNRPGSGTPPPPPPSAAARAAASQAPPPLPAASKRSRPPEPGKRSRPPEPGKRSRPPEPGKRSGPPEPGKRSGSPPDGPPPSPAKPASMPSSKPHAPSPVPDAQPVSSATQRPSNRPTQDDGGGEDPARSRARAVIRTCEAELTRNPEPRRAARLHYEIARSYEAPLRDLRRASAHYQEALERAPEHLPTIQAARRVFIARKSYQAALPLFDAEARITADPARKAALFLAKGRLVEDVLGNRDDARQPYAVAHELDRGSPAVLKALEQVQFDSAAWEALARTWERAANVVSADPRHRAALIVERARLIETKKNDFDAAIELYETALKLDARAHGAIKALKRLHHAQHRWRDLIRVLELEAEQAVDRTVRTNALYRIGRLHAERLGNRDEALAALERAARETPQEPLILEELARLYEAAERWESLVEVLQSLVDVTKTHDERVGLLHRMGQIYEEKVDQEDAALHCYEAARRLQPTFVPTLQALGAIYTRRHDWDSLLRVHQGEADHAKDPLRRASAHARMAEVLEDRLSRPEEAVDHHARALGLVPGYAPAFKALVRLLSAAQRWRDLLGVYERAVDQAKNKAQKTTFLSKIGAIYEDSLGEHGQAAHTYRRVLEVDPSQLGAIHALQRCTERAERWEEHIQALELEIEKTREKDDMVALLHRTAEVLDDKLGDRDGALDRLRRALSVDSKHTPSLRRIGTIFHRVGRWEDLLDIYKRELELAPRDNESVTLLQKMAELCETHLGRDDEAVTYYRRILDIDSTYGPALHALARILRERGDYRELIKVLELELEGLNGDDARARAAFRVGEVYEEQLGESQKAIAAYEQAVKAQPGHRPAVDALTRLRAEKQAYGPLAKELEQEAATTTDPALRIHALVQQAELWAEHLGEPRRAIRCYEQVLEGDRDHLGALVALERLYRRVGDYESLADIYARQARTVGDPGAKTTALRELARLYEMRKLGSGDEAQATYEAILELAPADGEALAALERLALEGEDRALLEKVHAHLADAASDPALRAAHRTSYAELLESRGAPEALASYRTALEEDPENIGATRGLSRLAERMDDPASLAEAARREAQVAHDGETAARLLVRSADVRIDRLGDIRGAVDDLERALELWPDSTDASERLRRALRGQEARLADLLARAASSTSDTERMAELWKEVADLQAHHLDNLAGAIGSLNRVLRAAPSHVPTLRRLAELYEADSQWNEAVQLLGRVVQLAPERDALADAHLRLASLWSESLGQVSRALVSLQAVLALDPGNVDALQALVDLQAREGRHEKALEAAKQLIEVTKGTDREAEALVRLAHVEDSRGRKEEAGRALQRAVALEGPSGEAAMTYKTYLQSPSEWERYIRALESYRNRASDPARLYLEIARVRFDCQARSEDAVEALEAGLSYATEAAVRQELAARLRLAGRTHRAIEELERILDEDLTRVEAWRDLCRSYLENQQPERARYAAEALVLFGSSGSQGQNLRLEHPPRPAAAEPGRLTWDRLRDLADFDEAEAMAGELLVALAPGLPKLYPADLDSFGLSPRDRITSRSGHPLRLLADRLAAIVGASSFELFVHRVRGRDTAIETGNPPAVVVPATIADQPEAERVFCLGRPLLRVALSFQAVDKLTPRELQVLLASAARNVRPGFGAGLTSEDFLDGQARRIHRVLPRRARKAAEQAATAYVDAPKVNFARWVAKAHRLSNRVAAVLADDLPSAVEQLRQAEGEQGSHDMVSLVRNSAEVADLLQFWASRRAMELRQDLGLVP